MVASLSGGECENVTPLPGTKQPANMHTLIPLKPARPAELLHAIFGLRSAVSSFESIPYTALLTVHVPPSGGGMRQELNLFRSSWL